MAGLADDAVFAEAGGKVGFFIYGKAEEAQVAGGFGSAISELTSQHMPMPVLRLGVEDRFGQSGSAQELLQAYGLTAQAMAPRIQQFIGAHT